MLKPAPARVRESPPESTDPERVAPPDPEGARGAEVSEASGSREALPGSAERVAPPPAVGPDGVEEGRRARAKKVPPHLSEEEYNLHMLIHIPFRSWCGFCLKGKTREDGHYKRDEPASAVPCISVDYCFFSRAWGNAGIEDDMNFKEQVEGDLITAFVIVDQKTGCVFSKTVRKVPMTLQ